MINQLYNFIKSLFCFKIKNNDSSFYTKSNTNIYINVIARKDTSYLEEII